MISRRFLITKRGEQILSCLMDGSRAVEIHLDARETSRLGDIWIGKILNIARNIQAAFVEVEPGVTGYLPLEDLKNPVYTKKGKSEGPQAGDELLVQVVRDAQKTKYMTLSTNLTLTGKYVILTNGNPMHSVSSKLGKSDRERLLKVLQESVPAGSDSGWIVRTNAAAADEAAIMEEIQNLHHRFQELMSVAMYRTCYSCLQKREERYLTRLMDLYSDSYEEILTDDEDLYEEVSSFLNLHMKESVGRLRLYKDRMVSMTSLYSLESRLQEALSEKVWLPGGGYLIIQATEALTVVDVNTGSYEKGKEKESVFLKVNLEAAEETARQLRLRNISGMIIIDFINMKKQEHKETLPSALRNACRKDPVRCDVVDMTALELVEMTRRKVEAPLAEQVRRKP